MYFLTACQIYVVVGSGDRFTQWTWARECPKCDIGPWDLLPTASLQSTGLCTGNIGLASLFYHAHTMWSKWLLYRVWRLSEIKFYWQVKQLQGFAWHSGHHYCGAGFWGSGWNTTIYWKVLEWATHGETFHCLIQQVETCTLEPKTRPRNFYSFSTTRLPGWTFLADLPCFMAVWDPVGFVGCHPTSCLK